MPVKWLCEILGMNHKSQKRSIKNRDMLAWKILSVRGENWRYHDMFCLAVNQVHYWLYCVPTKSVRREMVQSLVDYIEESNQALRHRRQYGIAINPRADAEDIENTVRESLDKQLGLTLADSNSLIKRRQVCWLKKSPSSQSLAMNHSLTEIRPGNVLKWPSPDTPSG